jgi:1,4-alpha-glucan branching enzyme
MKTNQKWKESINEKLFFMNTLHEKSSNGIYSANNSIKPVNFYCSARGAKMVQLAGDFNHWYPILMAQREDGCWFIQVWLPHGHHQYRFLVDGEPTLDLHATGTARDEHDDPVSLIAVS